MAFQKWTKLHLIISGTTPLKIDSPKCVNPTHPVTRAVKKIRNKRNRTEDEEIMLLDLGWLGAIWCDDDITCLDAMMNQTKPVLTGAVVYVPGEYVEGAIVNGMKATKKKMPKADQNNFIRVVDDRMPLQYTGPQDLWGLWHDNNFRDVRIVSTKTGEKMLKCTPRFNKWTVECDIEYNPSVVSASEIAEAIEFAGMMVGIGAHRKKYGRFTAQIV